MLCVRVCVCVVWVDGGWVCVVLVCGCVCVPSDLLSDGLVCRARIGGDHVVRIWVLSVPDTGSEKTAMSQGNAVIRCGRSRKDSDKAAGGQGKTVPGALGVQRFGHP